MFLDGVELSVFVHRNYPLGIEAEKLWSWFGRFGRFAKNWGIYECRGV
jgi:hypothetical protein